MNNSYGYLNRASILDSYFPIEKIFFNNSYPNFAQEVNVTQYSTETKNCFENFSCAIRDCDLDTVRPGEWINDMVISFIYEYLTHNFLKDAKERILLMEPCVVQLITSPDASVIFESLKIRQQEWIFLPINDASKTSHFSTIAGSHWALMVMSPIKKLAYYLDSSGSSNYNLAIKICNALCEYCMINVVLEPLACVQQDNCYDCGIFCLVFTEKILDYIIRGDNSWISNGNLNDFSLKCCSQSKRQEISYLITKYLNTISKRRINKQS